MGRIAILVVVSGLLLNTWLASGAAVFLPKQSADMILKRQKRYNTGHLEELMKDNLERECIEERCVLEEAREVFEDYEKTMEFWVSYVDGDQCESFPCQNGGSCEDGMNSYVCWCLAGFNGKNCEIEIARQCNVNNGGCMQFCLVDKLGGATCECAHGYQLAEDKKSCHPIGEYPCGRLGKSVMASLTTRSLINAETVDQNQLTYDDHFNASEKPSGNATSVGPTPVENVTDATVTLLTPADTNGTLVGALNKNASWNSYPTLPTITEKKKSDYRIVGGDEATPGEIPWQAALINSATKLVFCGGSLLTEYWVITAAHCIAESTGPFFVRLGEHNSQRSEGTESDHQVEEYRLHPHYNSKKSVYNHDIALLRLSTPITFTDRIIPVCLGPKDFTEYLIVNAGTSLVSGWGRERYNGMESPVLKKVEVPYVDRLECKGSSSDRVTRFMFCAGYSSVQKDSCQGDSGGPHASRFKNTWFLTGIVSWGEECAMEGKYGIYTRVSRYYNWISNITGLKISHKKLR
ncbi:coagulation factor IXb [Denticeps clupeoides]|uniref:Coagulation factor IX n=1 Tax=Denticeps clupeoides TaxID=299321 RepID=A0AAY4B015_9TELE|nr:coagulation factor IX [Denticeps clupeoides]